MGAYNWHLSRALPIYMLLKVMTIGLSLLIGTQSGVKVNKESPETPLRNDKQE